MMSKELQSISLGEIKPGDWIKEQMQKDLDGFVGHLDRLAPGLMIDDKIYGEHRLTKKILNKDVGNLQPDDEWNVQYLWWNSESQSNWWDGYLRHAFMLTGKRHLNRVEQYIDYILSTQDEDGYIGIYAPDLRYNFNSENGELWSKATLYRVLLAYYDATKKDKVLKAITRAVKNVMDNYPINSSHPFLAHKPYAGIAHGLMFTDVLDKLFQITGEKIYKDYAVFLFNDYCRQEVSEKDVQLKNIQDESYKHAGHGVHTYEHVRSLALARFATSDPELEKALTIYLQRIENTTTPSGGPIGDEWIFGRSAHATETGYEYCSIQELMDSYLFLLRKTGDFRFADKVEKTFLNAAQGARHPEHSSIAYLKTDNSFEMCGTKYQEVENVKKQTRYKYSPVHQDVAVCCSPNAGRITPYFVQNMWMKDEEGLIACLFGPCETEMSFNDKKIFIKETTSYPYDFSLTFEITTNQPVDFVLKIRKPLWSKKFTINVPFEEKQ
ncbi:MAG TPA: beta-L-arabinofuranosidase domain-containing protein, partial [Chitinophagaceae bacterium]|nr:beta-L-arabinofuranosidase domain-containing protein [Chitinophagaceae bacterium]